MTLSSPFGVHLLQFKAVVFTQNNFSKYVHDFDKYYKLHIHFNPIHKTQYYLYLSKINPK